MFEHLTESDNKGKEMNTKFRTAYLITIILSGFGLIFLFTVMQPLIYLLYGYVPNIIDTYTPESFQATRETYPARIGAFYAIAGITVLCFVLSFIALFRRTYLKSYLITLMVFILSASLSLFYWFVWIVSGISGAGMLG